MAVNSLSRETHTEPTEIAPWSGDVFLFPTTVAQQGFWFLDQIDPGNPAYNIAVRFKLTGRFDQDAFESAVQALIRRHEILRTRIGDFEGVPVQVVSSELRIPIGFVDLSGMPEDRRLPHSEILAISEAGKRFDLRVGPLLRVSLLRLGVEEHILLMTIHHIIADGWSIGIIVAELGSLYQSAHDDEPEQLAPLSLQFGDFAVWQQGWAQSRDFQSRLRYWKDTLAALPRLEIPTDRARPPLQTSNGFIHSILLPKDLTDRLNAICRRHEATLFMLTLAALKVMIKNEIKSNDVYVGTLIAGRSRVEIEPLIGPFINPLVLRTILRDDGSFLDVLASVKKTVLDAIEHGDLPFERLVNTIQPRRDMSRHAVFQINFIFQRDFVRSFESAGLSLKAIPSKSPGAIYDLNFFLVEREEGWRSSCEFNTDLYDGSTIDRLLKQHKAILLAIADDPAVMVSELCGDGVFQKPVSGGDSSRRGRSLAMGAPVDSVESKLLEIWRQSIDLDSIELDDDFFDIGGHSLLALKILSQIERAFGQRLALATFLHEPTIRALAARLREERSRSRRDQVIAFHQDGTKAPLILVDTGSYYRPLIRRLGADQPIFGLALPDLQELPRRFQVEDIAANLIEALRDVQPRGPYYLCGWCHAGIIAFEMAQQLIADGEDVPAVMLFDSDDPCYVRQFKTFRALPVRLFFFAEKLVYHFGRLRKSNSKAMIRYTVDRIQTVLQVARQRFWGVFYRTAVHYDYEHLKTSSWFQFLAVAEYHPKPIETPIILFRSHDLQTGRFRDPSLGWGGAAQCGLIVHEMAGNHSAMFEEPGVEALAKAIAALIPVIASEHDPR